MTNGTKTHPLSEHALAALKRVAREPLPSSEINPGVVNRLLRDSFVEDVRLPSPFKSHKGALISHLQITEAGRSAAHIRADE